MGYRVLRYCLMAGLLVSALGAACSAETTQGFDDPLARADGGAGNGSDGDNDGNGGGSSGSTGGGYGGGTSGGTAASGGSMDEEDICAGKKVDPEPVEITVETLVPYEVVVPEPIAVYIMLDKTGSMDDRNTPTKWQVAVDAINTFVNDPDSAFINVALQYFSGNDQGLCDGVAWSTPAVPMGPLPDNAPNISASLAATSPGGNTPIEGALRGLTQFCTQFQAQNPDIKCVGVLISDGRPTSCNQDSQFLVDIAANAYANSDVRTFTVGMQGDTDFVLLDNIALWGGTDCTPNPDGTANPADGHYCDVRPGSGMTLLQAFEAIRSFVTTLEERTEYRTEVTSKISECEWGIPDPPEGETFDKDMVNVIFSQPDEDDITIPRVDSQEECADVSDGWYYDDPEEPTQLISCEQTCEFITSVEGAVIDIQFGCETEIAKLE
jgi:hypothetical protein